MSPCGTIVDMLKTLSMQRMQLSADPDDWCWVRWQWCRPGAQALSYWTAYGSQVWEDHRTPEPDGPKIPLGPAVRVPPQTSPYDGQAPHGKIQWYEDGLPVEDRIPFPGGAQCGAYLISTDVPVSLEPGPQVDEPYLVGDGVDVSSDADVVPIIGEGIEVAGDWGYLADGGVDVLGDYALVGVYGDGVDVLGDYALVGVYGDGVDLLGDYAVQGQVTYGEGVEVGGDFGWLHTCGDGVDVGGDCALPVTYGDGVHVGGDNYPVPTYGDGVAVGGDNYRVPTYSDGVHVGGHYYLVPTYGDGVYVGGDVEYLPYTPMHYVSASGGAFLISPLDIPAPADMSPGDRLIAVIVAGQSSTDLTYDPLWDFVGQSPVGGASDQYISVFSRTVTGSEPAYYRFWAADPFALMLGAIVCTRGVTTITLGASGTANDSTPAVPGVTVPAPDSLLLWCVVYNVDGTLGGLPPGFVSGVHAGDYPYLDIAYLDGVASGATGTLSGSLSMSQNWTGFLIAYNP